MSRYLISLLGLAVLLMPVCSNADDGFAKACKTVQPKMVKINGSGGFRGLEAYQSGFLISSDGIILTVWSYVLDSDVLTITLDNGQKYEAKLKGYDPQLEIALLKIDASDLPFFSLDQAVDAKPPAKVLAFSNLYEVATGDEPYSVLQGVISTKCKLAARRGAVETNYRGDGYIVDAMTNNPGAAGGALTNHPGELLGVLGKELRDQQTNTWLNFAIPISALAASVYDIQSGKMIVGAESSRNPPSEPMTPKLLGFKLVPNVVTKTPPFIDQVRSDSPFGRAGILPDDLLIAIGGNLTPSCNDVNKLLSLIDRDAEISVTVQRDREFKTVDVRLGR